MTPHACHIFKVMGVSMYYWSPLVPKGPSVGHLGTEAPRHPPKARESRLVKFPNRQTLSKGQYQDLKDLSIAGAASAMETCGNASDPKES